MTNRRDAQRRREHDAFRLLIAATVDGTVHPDDSIALKAHLESCRSCRADQRAMLEDHRWLATPRVTTLPEPSIRDSVVRAARSRAIPRFGPQVRPWAGLAAAGLAVALIGAGLVWWSRPPSNASVQPSQTPRETTGACAPMAPGLTAWWTLDGHGSDLLGQHDLTTQGGAHFTPGYIDDALTFDGVSAYATLPVPGVLAIGDDDYTVQLWVRFEQTDGEQVLIEQWREGDSQRAQQGWTLTKLESGDLLATTGSPTGTSGAIVESAFIDTQGWHHVALRRSGRVTSIFIDGVLRASETRDFETADLSVDAPMMIGRRGDLSGFFLHGQLDDIQLAVGRAFSDDEISATFAAGARGTCRS